MVGSAYFKNDAVFNEYLIRITDLIDRKANFGAFERLFSPEGKMSDSILILGYVGVKNTRTFDENDELRGCVKTFDI